MFWALKKQTELYPETLGTWLFSSSHTKYLVCPQGRLSISNSSWENGVPGLMLISVVTTQVPTTSSSTLPPSRHKSMGPKWTPRQFSLLQFSSGLHVVQSEIPSALIPQLDLIINSLVPPLFLWEYLGRWLTHTCFSSAWGTSFLHLANLCPHFLHASHKCQHNPDLCSCYFSFQIILHCPLV